MHKLYYFFSTTHLHPHLIQFRSVHSHDLLYFFFLKKHVPSRCILGYLKGQSWKFSIRRRPHKHRRLRTASNRPGLDRAGSYYCTFRTQCSAAAAIRKGALLSMPVRLRCRDLQGLLSAHAQAGTAHTTVCE